MQCDEPRELHLNDFAYGRTVEAPAGSVAYKITLPLDIYRGLARNDLGDIRVFNAKAEIVPHELSRLSASTRTVATQEELPLFRIEGNPDLSSTQNQITIAEDPTGKVLSVRFSDKEEAKAGPTSYLLDVRKFSNHLHALDFEWSAPLSNQIIPLSVEASGDLSLWQPLSQGSVLARFSYGQEFIEQGHVEFPARRIQFLKVTMPTASNVTMVKALGSFTVGEEIAPRKEWTRIAGSVDPKDSARFLYNSQSPLPVSAVRLSLPEPNTLVRVVIKSRSSDRDLWVEQFSGVVYHLSANDQLLQSPHQELQRVVSHRQWSVEINGKDAQIGSASPELLLGWVPHELTFLARGDAPFRLAYGSVAVTPPDFGVTSLGSLVANSSGQGLAPTSATLGSIIELGGKDKLTAPPVVTPLPWRTWTLWAILAIFLIALGRMTWKLGVDLKNTSK